MDKSLLARTAGRHEFYLGLLVLLLAIGLSAGTDEFLTLGNLTDVATSYAILGIGLRAVRGADRRRHRHFVPGGYRHRPVCDGQLGDPARRQLPAGVRHGDWRRPAARAGERFLVYWLKVPAIIITIATLNLFYGLLVYATNGFGCTASRTGS